MRKELGKEEYILRTKAQQNKGKNTYFGRKDVLFYFSFVLLVLLDLLSSVCVYACNVRSITFSLLD